MAHRTGSLPRKLVAGCYGGLELDFACGRGHAFDESWLHQLITKIATANIDPKASSFRKSFAVPQLQAPGRTAGRKREVDFAIVDLKTASPAFFIEAKWANSSHCTPATILMDVARLAVVHAAYPDAICLFVLAGGKSSVASLFSKPPLAPPTDRKHGVLHYPYDSGRSSFPLRSDGNTNSALPKSLLDRLAVTLPLVPRFAHTVMYEPSHVSTPNWSVFVWRVYSA